MVALQLNSGSVNKVFAFSYLNPYWTWTGISRGFDVFRRDVDTSSLSVAAYRTYSTGAGMRFRHPVSRVRHRERRPHVRAHEAGIDLLTAPPRYIAFILEFGETTDTLRLNTTYSHDTRDSLTWPTRGWLTELGLEVGIPPGDLTYYRGDRAVAVLLHVVPDPMAHVHGECAVRIRRWLQGQAAALLQELLRGRRGLRARLRDRRAWAQGPERRRDRRQSQVREQLRGSLPDAGLQGEERPPRGVHRRGPGLGTAAEGRASATCALPSDSP
jgi:hypothetical protein